jgi:magnesium-transporting ATPase (P-type)
MHAQTHTLTLSRTHSLTLTLTHALSHARTLPLSLSRTHSLTLTLSHTLSHAHTHALPSYRTLCLAQRELAENTDVDALKDATGGEGSLEAELVITAIVGIKDPPRAEVSGGGL